MRVPQFRFTLRRVTTLAAFCVVILGLVVGEFRRARFRKTWDKHATLMEQYENFHYTGPGGQDYVQRFERNHRIWRHHSDMASKYKVAAWLPWLPVAPDPPEPE